MREAVEPGPFLVVGTQDVPGASSVSVALSIKSRAREYSNQSSARQVHRAELPMAERVFDSCLKPALLPLSLTQARF